LNKIKFIIREANKSDTEGIAKVVVDAFAEKFRVFFGRRKERAEEIIAKSLSLEDFLEGIFVAEVDNEVAGTINLETKEMKGARGNIPLSLFIKNLGISEGIKASLIKFFMLHESFDSDSCYIVYIGVSSEARGKGIGKALLQRGEDFAREKGRRYLSLAVASNNDIAHRLYQKVGFKDIKSNKNILTKLIFGIGTWIYMKKELS